MTKARDLSKLLSTANGKIAGANLDVSFENISDTGTAGTKVASGTTGQRGSTAGQIRFNTTTGLAEYYTGSEFKVIDSPPTITVVSPLEVDSTAGGNITFTITGSNFQSGAVAKFIANDATELTASTTTVNSSSSISAVIARSSFVGAKEPYDVRVINTSGLSGTLDNQINVDVSPTWSTASGQIGGVIEEGDSVSTSVTATDADSDTIVYSINSGTLPTGLSLNSSTGAITGTAPAVSGDTTSSFTLRATANSKTADRAFNIVIKELVLNGATSAKAARSCKTIFNLGGAYQGSGANGLYWITNYGTIAAQQHYCLMDSTYSGGGWTLLYAGSSATTDWSGSNYQFNLNNSATPSPTTLYARNRSGTFTPTTSDKFMLRREDNLDFKVHTIGSWNAGSTWQNLSGHYNLSNGGSTVDANGNNMAGFACFECCAGAGGCQNNSGGDLCGFGRCESLGCYNNGGGNECFGGAWATSGASQANLSWGNGNNIEGTYASYWYRRDSASE
jgi:hypothetical protein